MRSKLQIIINEDTTQTKQLSRIALSASRKAQKEALQNGTAIVTAINGAIVETKPDGSKITIKAIQSQNHKINNHEKIVKFKFK
ncbi:hypothetical protein [Aquella oligotrophica]|nr:hypothetical protein [Aquella oligotrophica]